MPSARDIAQMLGLSPATVSMVFNGKPGVSEETRALVLKTAEEIGYRPHQRSNNHENLSIALLVYNDPTDSSSIQASQNHFFLSLIEGACQRAQELSYPLRINYIYGDSEEEISSVLSGVQAVILLSCSRNEIPEALLDRISVPFVLLDRISIRPINTISINNVQGVALAVQYLVSLGHRKLGFVGATNAHNTNISERMDGYKRAVLSRPDTAASADTFFYNSLSEDYHTLMEALKSADSLPTGFICANDWCASKCIRALKEMGIRVPEDVSVIGFDNIDSDGFTTPSLTTINVPKCEMGRIAVDRLIQLLSETAPSPAVRSEVYTNLVIRESTGPCSK